MEILALMWSSSPCRRRHGNLEAAGCRHALLHCLQVKPLMLELLAVEFELEALQLCMSAVMVLCCCFWEQQWCICSLFGRQLVEILAVT